MKLEAARRRLRPRWVLTFVVLAFCAGLIVMVPKGGRPLVLGAQLTSVADFSVNGTVSNLAPGVGSPITLDFGNPYTNPVDAITVTSVTVTVSPTPSVSVVPPNCPADTYLSLQYNATTIPFTGTTPSATITYSATNQPYVPANTPASGPGAVTNGDISVLLAAGAGSVPPGNTDCQNVTFPLNFSAAGTYMDATTSSLVSSLNPVGTGQPVTFTDSVTPSMSGETPSPTGTVTFYDSSTPITCTSSTPFTFNSGTNTGTATCTVSYAGTGSHSISAKYSGDGSYTASTSNTVTENVVSSSCVSVATSGSNVMTITGTYGGNDTVIFGKILYLDGGTITGNVTVNSGGSLVTQGGTIQGNLTSNGGPVEFQGATTVNGNVSTTNSQFAASAGTLVRGNLSVTGDSVFCATGTTAAPITVQGNLSVQHLSNGASNQYLCGVVLGGNLTYQQNGSPAFIGGSASCPGNTISGNLAVQNNTGPLTIGNNTVNGNITISGDSGGIAATGNTAKGNIGVSGNGGGTFTSNSAGGNCSMSGDSPPVTGSGNTAKGGTDTCNRTA